MHKNSIELECTKTLTNLNFARRDVIPTLRRFGDIEEITEVQAATFDLAVETRYRTLKELAAFIEDMRSIEGIEEMSLAIIVEGIVLLPKIPVRT